MTNMEGTVDTTLLLIKLCIDLLCPPLKSGHLVGFGLFLHLLSTFSKFFGTKVLNRNTNDIRSQKKKKKNQIYFMPFKCVHTSYVCPSRSLASRQFPHVSRTRRFLARCRQQ